jgi:hypothetical protein
MREACLFIGFISGSYTVPDLKGDKRGLMVFKEDHLQAVWQNGFKNLFFEPGLGKGCGKETKEKDEKI